VPTLTKKPEKTGIRRLHPCRRPVHDSPASVPDDLMHAATDPHHRPPCGPETAMSEDKKPTVESLARALAEARAVIADQKARLKSLGNGREEGMLALAATRAELDRVKRERDQLREQLNRVEGMQTSTVALPEEDEAAFMPDALTTLMTTPDEEGSLFSQEEVARLRASYAYLDDWTNRKGTRFPWNVAFNDLGEIKLRASRDFKPISWDFYERMSMRRL